MPISVAEEDIQSGRGASISGLDIWTRIIDIVIPPPLYSIVSVLSITPNVPALVISPIFVVAAVAAASPGSAAPFPLQPPMTQYRPFS